MFKRALTLNGLTDISSAKINLDVYTNFMSSLHPDQIFTPLVQTLLFSASDSFNACFRRASQVLKTQNAAGSDIIRPAIFKRGGIYTQTLSLGRFCASSLENSGQTIPRPTTPHIYTAVSDIQAQRRPIICHQLLTREFHNIIQEANRNCSKPGAAEIVRASKWAAGLRTRMPHRMCHSVCEEPGSALNPICAYQHVAFLLLQDQA